MLVSISQLVRVGRFNRWDAATATRAASRLRRLSLIFGRNASGKSTLARVLRAATHGSAAELVLDQTLDASDPPLVQLDLDEGSYKFDGTGWRGTAPAIVVFDRKFVEDNVYVGQLSSKRHRTQILQIALGTEDVSLATNLDALSKQSRALNHEDGPHEKLLRLLSSKHGMLEKTFAALMPVADAAKARAALDVREKDAAIARELMHRPVPIAPPVAPALDFDVIEKLLATSATEVAASSAAAVRAHLDKRLGGEGEAWVREGLEFTDGKTCPFCAHPLEKKSSERDLIDAFAAHFDRTYVDLAGAIELAIEAAERIATWWASVEKVVADNEKAFAAWSTEAPELEVEADAADVSKQLTALLEKKQRRPSKAVAADDDIRSAFDQLVEARDEYTAKADAVRATVTKRVKDAQAGAQLVAIANERKQLDAIADRFTDAAVHAFAERTRLAGELAKVAAAKQKATEEMQQRTTGQLAQFTARMNELLAMLCTDFTLGELETERSGGTTGARFTLQIPAGRLSVASAAGEEKLARVLSDGDRSALALALFVYMVETNPDLEDTIVMFDDPMTSQDAQRSEATAEQITRLAKRANQVIVVSHLAAFLLQVSYDWRRHGGEPENLAELELDRAGNTLRPWSASDHASDEPARRGAELRAFAADPASDAFAPRMHSEIRKLIEDYVRASRPALFASGTVALEALVRKLRGDAKLLASVKWTAADLEELDRIVAFAARAGVNPAPEPSAVRAMAKRAVAFVDK